MIPYIIFVIIILLCYYKRSSIGILLVMILFAGLRYNTGWDYVSYTEIIETPEDWEKYSWFWITLFKISSNIKSPHFAIAFTNTLTYIILYSALRHLGISKNRICQALIVYVFWYSLYLGSFSVIRQSLAVSLGLLMFSYLQKRAYLKSLISYLIAIQLHPSAIILIVLYPIFLSRTRLNVKTVLISSILLIVGLFFLNKLIQNIAILSTYLVYLDWTQKDGGLMVFVDIVLSIYLIFSFSKIKNISSIGRQCFSLSIITFIGRCATFFIGLSSVMSRIFDYFLIFMVIIVFPSIQIFKDKKTISHIVIITMVLFFIVYLEISKGGTQLASSGYIPYRFIFNK